MPEGDGLREALAVGGAVVASDGVMLSDGQDRAEKKKYYDHDIYKAYSKTTDDFATEPEESIYENNRWSSNKVTLVCLIFMRYATNLHTTPLCFANNIKSCRRL